MTWSMAKIQRRFVKGSEYRVEGVAKNIRRLEFLGQTKLRKLEVLMFRPLRKASKQIP